MYDEDGMTFLHDFFSMIKIFDEIDSEYGNADQGFEANLKHFRNYVTGFNNKYPNLHAKIEMKTMSISLRIFLRAIKDKRELKEFFPVSESRMESANQDKLFLKSGKEGLELIFTPQEILNEDSMEFRTLLAVALKDKTPTKIDLQKIFSKIAFKTKPDYSQKTFST